MCECVCVCVHVGVRACLLFLSSIYRAVFVLLSGFFLFLVFFTVFLACWFVCFPGNLFHWTFVCVLQLQM